VPAKPFSEAKSRLSPVLSSPERAAAAMQLLSRTLDVLTRCAGIERLLVTSSDPVALAVAAETGAVPLPESEPLDLNGAITRALDHALASGAGRALVIAADLPLLSTADIEMLLAHPEDAIVIAPDRHVMGTNALVLAPPTVMEPAFGQDSYARHLQDARAIGAQPRIIRTEGLGFDLDLPEDYRDLLKLAPGRDQQSFLASLPA
jgi:2-phospho-L-lactate guanylyltransferase